MHMKPALILVLALLPLGIVAQGYAPLRVEAEFDSALWLEGEYILAIEDLMAIAPVLSVGGISATEMELGIGARLYPLSRRGTGLYVDFKGIYVYQSGQILDPRFDYESAGLGYRIIVFGHLTGNAEGGVSIQNEAQTRSLYGRFGLGLAL
jgi:hypothetical protein